MCVTLEVITKGSAAVEYDCLIVIPVLFVYKILKKGEHYFFLIYDKIIEYFENRKKKEIMDNQRRTDSIIADNPLGCLLFQRQLR